MIFAGITRPLRLLIDANSVKPLTILENLPIETHLHSAAILTAGPRGHGKQNNKHEVKTCRMLIANLRVTIKPQQDELHKHST